MLCHDGPHALLRLPQSELGTHGSMHEGLVGLARTSAPGLTESHPHGHAQAMVARRSSTHKKALKHFESE